MTTLDSCATFIVLYNLYQSLSLSFFFNPPVPSVSVGSLDLLAITFCAWCLKRLEKDTLIPWCCCWNHRNQIQINVLCLEIFQSAFLQMIKLCCNIGDLIWHHFSILFLLLLSQQIYTGLNVKSLRVFFLIVWNLFLHGSRLL